MKERLQKHLARAGLGSRRYCETLIEQGRVAVNGVLVDRVGFTVDPEVDQIAVDGETIAREALVYYLLHKPKGFVCSNRPQGDSRSAVDLVQSRKGERLFSVGRLDEQSQGALILTNDGEFGNRIIHPRYGVEKTYLVVVKGKPEATMLEKIRRGIHLAEGKTAPARVHVVKRSRSHSMLKVTLHEGKNRHLRRIFARIGLPVTEIIRLQIGSVTLGPLKPGHYRELKPAEIEALLDESRAEGRSPPSENGAVAADVDFEPVERIARDSDSTERRARIAKPNAANGTDRRAPRKVGSERSSFRPGPRRPGAREFKPDRKGPRFDARPHVHRGDRAGRPGGKPTRGPRGGAPTRDHGSTKRRRFPDAERTNFPADDGSPFSAFDREPEE